MWGMALAALDRERLDRELFYWAALVHDWEPRPQFRARTSRSGEPNERWHVLGPRTSIRLERI